MKKLSLLIVGLLCLSGVADAGEVISNNSGESATGLRVVFSTPVLITDFGEVLTSVDPQMLAFEFVFSGGVVEPWGSHWMNWAPATAQIIDVEWLAASDDAVLDAAPPPAKDLSRLGYFFGWTASDIIGLDDCDISNQGWDLAAPNDLIAVYSRESSGRLEFRVDFLDLPAAGVGDIAVQVEIEVPATSKDMFIDLRIPAQGTPVLRSTSGAAPDVADLRVDRELDAIAFAVLPQALHELGWTEGSHIRVRVTSTDSTGQSAMDVTDWFSSSSTGIKPVPFIYAPLWAIAGDCLGYSNMRFFLTENRTGYLPLLQTCDRYEQPIAPTLTEGLLVAADLEGVVDYLLEMQERGLLEVTGFAGRSFPLTWYSRGVTAKAIAQTGNFIQGFGINWGPAFMPYDDILKAEDLAVIKNAGFTTVSVGAYNSYYYWFGEYPERSSHPAFELHRANELDIVFWTGCIACKRFRQTHPTPGTRKLLLHHVLNQAAYYQSVVVYWDDGWQLAEIWPERFPGIGVEDFEEFVRWIAAHPWIDMTTYSGLLAMNLNAHDVGSISPIDDFNYMPDDEHYRAYHDLTYYGGIADGHSPTVPEGQHIEGYAEYVPILAAGEPIPSGRSMGDDQTPGTIVYEVVHSLETAPDNQLTELGWFSFFRCSEAIAERADASGAIGGPYIPEGTKVAANMTGQIGKVAYASRWAEAALAGEIPVASQAEMIDLDFDGELEAVLFNDKVLAMFENDGGRMDFLFSCDGVNAYPLVYPAWLLNGPRYSGGIASHGEAAVFGWGQDLAEWHGRDLAFVEVGRELEIYSVDAIRGTVTLRSPDKRITKSFAILDSGSQIEVKYETLTLTQIHVGFCVNPLSVFSPGISDRWEAQRTPTAYAVSNQAGGAVALGFEDDYLTAVRDFTKAPWNYIPYHSMIYQDSGVFYLDVETGPETTPTLQTVVETPIRIHARGESFEDDWPILRISSSLGPEHNVQIDTETAATFPFSMNLPIAAQSLCIDFINDSAGPGGDRNVFIDWIEVAGERYELEETDYTVKRHEVLESGGEVRFYYGATICFDIVIQDPD